VFAFQEYKRRAIVPLAGLALAAYYLLVFVWLAHRAAQFDGPLRQHWKDLASALDQTNATALDFQRITNQLRETRQALTVLASARKKAQARFDLSPDLRAKMTAESFSVVEYENARGTEMDELGKLAKEQQVTLEPAVLAGFPKYTVEVLQPALLWPALSLVDGLLTTAIQSKVTAIHSLESPLVFTNAPAANAAGRLAQIPLQVELTGPVAGVLRLLQSLPLRGEELRAAGFTNATAGKLPLLLERLILKKQSPDKPDEVRVSLRLVGFVFQE
jgi:hypothetical protein